MNRAILLFAALFHYAIVSAAEVILNFDNINGSTEQSFSLIPGSTGVSAASYTGSIRARVVYDEETLAVSEFTVLQGEVRRYSDDLFTSGNINYTGVGTYRTEIRVSVSESVMRITTPSGFGRVDASTGVLDNRDHYTQITQGSLTMGLSIPSLEASTEETQSLISEAGTDDTTEMKIVVTENVSDFGDTTVLFQLEITTDATETEAIEETSSSFSLSEKGTVTGTSTITLPGPYRKWANISGLVPETMGSANQFGHRYQALFALDLPADSQSLPTTFQHLPGRIRPAIAIRLPDDGLKLRLRMYVSDTLEPGSWEELPSHYMLNGPFSFDKGTSGTVYVIVPENDASFFSFDATSY